MTVPMALLALLDDGPTHGFDLKRRYDALLGHDRELKYGQVYSTLARLERDGLAAGVGIEAGAGADRKVYAITPAGVSELDAWLASPQPAGGRPSELFTRVVLALVSGRPAELVLDAHRRVYLDRMRELTAARRSGDVIDRLAGDYEAAHLSADLEWIELASARLADIAAAVRAVGGVHDELVRRAGGGTVSEIVLEGRGLRHSYGPTRVLDGVDVAVGTGEVVAVMGPSGSGKSTLLHLLAGLLRPDSGEVWLAGRRVDTLSERRRSELRLRRFGFVFQFGDLVPELTVEENVELPLRLTGVRSSSARARATAMLDRLGVADQADKRLSEVSGGQAQRAAVARALVHTPPVVLADEPTGSLDTVTGELVLEALVGTATEQGTAVLLVTHELRVASWASRDIQLRDGRVVADGVPVAGRAG